MTLLQFSISLVRVSHFGVLLVEFNLVTPLNFYDNPLGIVLAYLIPYGHILKS